jgi:predicted extracellular nuclease
MKKLLPFICIFIAISVSAQIEDCTDLFISEYVEGSQTNKALEIYNPTSQEIDLSSYMIIRYSNGVTSAGSGNAIQLTGMIGPNDVHVGVIEKLDPSGTGQNVAVSTVLQSYADEFYCPDYSISNAWYFNGNDAIVLARGTVNDITNSVTVDVFGKVGEDPGSGWNDNAASGFTSSGYSWTEDHTLIRKNTVLTGDLNPIDLFNPSLEWDSIPEDTWTNLGEHTCDCASGSTSLESLGKASYNLYPNPANIGEIVSIKSNLPVKRILVTNILGEQLSFENFINTGLLVKGMYIIDVEFVNGSNSNTKLIIE